MKTGSNHMRFFTLNLSHLTWLVFFFGHFLPCLSDARISEAALYCGPNRTSDIRGYFETFVVVMESISQQVNSSQWGTNAVTNSTPPMYGLFQCHRDLSPSECLMCYATARTGIPHCLPSTSARLYLDGCFLRYDNFRFYNESTRPSIDSVNCNATVAPSRNQVDRLEFQRRVGQLVDNVTRTATANRGFGVGEGNGVYGLAQCWRSLSAEGCRQCLESAGREVRRCLPSREGRGLNAGCYLRYSTVRFYNDGADGNNGGSGGSSRRTIIVATLATTIFLILSLVAAYVAYIRASKLKARRSHLGRISIAFRNSGLSFKYETLEKATNFFDPARKLGQGGAGSVYRGTLPDGQTVAVKRLFFSTRQWVDEFFNEVNLINGIQHKNLVKLLGCSIEGPESLLVYEYVPNKGLDRYISANKNEAQILSWKQRFHIIVGTAEGLAHLHGGSQAKIIHRDIKSSNVLLDENMAPKIADFGLARCLAADKSHLSTGIAGTLGYMAPEYLVRGQLTEKADVYSFGVLVLEIVCGRKNNAFDEDSSSLLQTVWQLSKTNKLAEAMDPCLKDEATAEEVSNVLQIGLLCTQASAALRPSMAEVVHMLTTKDCEIPIPNQPPFLNPRALNSTNAGRSHTMNSLLLNALSKIEMTTTSTESSSMQSSDRPSATSEEMRLI